MLEVELATVLPAVDSERDQCVARLSEGVAGLTGVDGIHVHDRDGRVVVCAHYDPARQSLQRLDRALRRVGAQVSDRYRHATLRVTGMDCGDCAASIEHVLGRSAGVLAVSVSYAAERLRVEFDADVVTLDALTARVEAMGYAVQAPPRSGWLATNRELLLAAATGVLLAAGETGQRLLDLPSAVAWALYGLAYLTGGFDATRHAAAAALRLRFQIDALMVIAALGAAAVGQPAEGALLLFLFSLGHALEHRAMGRARRAIEALGQLTPRTARVRRNDSEVDVEVGDLVRGDVVIVRAGERVPADGTVSTGESNVDQSPITGESVPVARRADDSVFAGSVNQDGTLEITVTRLASESTVARVIALVEEAQTQKSSSQQLTEKFSAIFVPAVLALSAAVLLAPPLLGWLSWQEAVLRAMTVLVAASPCALAIGTPAAVLSGIARAARGGVLIKGGGHLENLGRLDAIAFDKTGTLTSGKLRVVDVVPADGIDAATVLSAAAAVESRSTHPLARAVLAAAQPGAPARLEDLTTIPGRGLTARLDGHHLRVGRPSFALPDTCPPALRSATEDLERSGKTVVAVAQDDHPLGVLALADEPRPGAADTLTDLRRLKVTTLTMLTGDNEHVAAATAASLGLTDYHAGLLPVDKVAAIAELTTRHRAVAMIGDGINDAPALARATVGIAMGAAGTDVALETADVALMADDLRKLPFAISLGRRARRIILENLALALAVIAVLLPTALLGIAGIGAAILIHEGSTLLVVANALRLLT